MAENSNIGWTDSTVNWWWGCSHSGPGCLNCYAEVLNNFRGNKQWGPGAERRKIKGSPALIQKLNRQSAAFFAEHGRKRRVFMQSMSDTFDNEVDDTWRAEMFDAIKACRDINIQLVTKRGPNVPKMLKAIGHSWPPNAGLISTVVDKPEFDRDVPRLRNMKKALGIPWVGLSVEPMLDRIDMHSKLDGIDWVIVGCESGSNCRPFDLQWARDVRDACAAAGVSFFLKQIPGRGSRPIAEVYLFPNDLRCQEFPEALR